MELVRHDTNGRRYVVYCCDRCGKVTEGVHTCSPNPVIEQLRAKVAELEAQLAKYKELEPVAWHHPVEGLSYENHYTGNIPLYALEK